MFSPNDKNKIDLRWAIIMWIGFWWKMDEMWSEFISSLYIRFPLQMVSPSCKLVPWFFQSNLNEPGKISAHEVNSTKPLLITIGKTQPRNSKEDVPVSDVCRCCHANVTDPPKQQEMFWLFQVTEPHVCKMNDETAEQLVSTLMFSLLHRDKGLQEGPISVCVSVSVCVYRLLHCCTERCKTFTSCCFCYCLILPQLSLQSESIIYWISDKKTSMPSTRAERESS